MQCRYCGYDRITEEEYFCPKCYNNLPGDETEEEFQRNYKEWKAEQAEHLQIMRQIDGFNYELAKQGKRFRKQEKKAMKRERKNAALLGIGLCWLFNRDK